MKLTKPIHAFLMRLVKREGCPTRLSRSFCTGVMIAFCPLVGLHTLLAYIISRLWNLNLGVIFLTCITINNPWTAFGIYFLDYQVGCYISDNILQLPLEKYNPGWMQTLNQWLSHYIGIPSISLWAFFIGGGLLACSISVMLYPIMRYIFNHIIEQLRQIDAQDQ